MKDINNIVEELDRAMAQLPVDQLLSELQVVVERINFSKLQDNQENDISTTEIEALFQDEISAEMLAYVRWLHKNKLLLTLAGNNGILFLNFCIQKYKQITQVRFVTAIAISEDVKEYVRRALSQIYPPSARFIFEINPSLIAGFVIDDSTSYIDRSLRRSSIDTLHTYITKEKAGIAHG